MISIQLNPSEEQRFAEIARDAGEDVSELARTILLNYLEFAMLSPDSEEEWAEASVALAPETFQREDWGE